jgi:hypothetical protein
MILPLASIDAVSCLAASSVFTTFSAVASKVFSAISLFGWAAAAGDMSDDEAMACPIAPAIDKRPTVVRICLRLWPSFPLDTEHSCLGMTSSVAQGNYGVFDTPGIAAKIAARVDLPIKRLYS